MRVGGKPFFHFTIVVVPRCIEVLIVCKFTAGVRGGVFFVDVVGVGVCFVL